ncbi:MAG TPA: AAA family ATPase, partial [Clostridiales bacterium]|nr:AAA family ATPase [Clostridiales bacterium]
MYKLIIGSSDFKKVMENNGYYIDKTMLIKDVLEEGKEVVLLPRPRRFGKTLNMSMLYYFLNVEEKAKELFKGLKIEKEEDIMRQINSYPTI